MKSVTPIAILAGLLLLGSAFGGVIYVDKDAGGGSNNGSSWANAYLKLQDALAAAVANDEIWVSDGMYKPGVARTDSFQLKALVKVYGGFAGGETMLNQRDFVNNVCILSGDLVGNDGANFVNNSENVYHVVKGADGARLDGFRIEGGNADGTTPDNAGAGMLNIDASPKVVNCVFRSNSASDVGGGVRNKSTLPTAGNPPMFPQFLECVFSGNRSTGAVGGGMLNEGVNLRVLVSNTVFADNEATYGGAMKTLGDAFVIVTNSTFSKNNATTDGGAVAHDGTTTEVLYINSIFWGNTTAGAAEVQFSSGTPDVSYHKSIIEFGINGAGFSGPVATDEGGNSAADPTFVSIGNAAGADGKFTTADDGLRLTAGSPAIDTGSFIAAPDDCIDGLIRPQGGGIDMGAYEKAGGTIRRVFQEADGANNGTSWDDAYTTLAAAMAAAVAGDEIWVAAGSYNPGAPRAARSYAMVTGVGVFGGFNATEAQRNDRDPLQNVTILTGDINSDDITPGFTQHFDNNYHVVKGADQSFVDGFVIEGGNADGAAGPDNAGGGLLNNGQSTSAINCRFRYNRADNEGGAVANVGGAAAELMNCIFNDNESAMNGGAISNNGGAATVANGIFFDNSATSGRGGAIFSAGGAKHWIFNSTFTNNTANEGGALAFDGVNTEIDVVNSILSGDTAFTNPGHEIFNTNNAVVNVGNNILKGGVSGITTTAGATTNDDGNNLDKNPRFVNSADPDGLDNICPSSDDGLRFRVGSPAADTGTMSLIALRDILGNGRPDSVTREPDMGAFEGGFGPPAALGHWPFDEGTGTAAGDTAPGMDNGTLTNGPTWSTSVAPIDGGTFSLEFDGTNDYVQLNNGKPLFQLDGPMTISAWICPRDVSDVTIVDSTQVGKGFVLRIGSSGLAEFAIDRNPEVIAASTTALTVDKWYHLAGVFDGTNLQIFVNGLDVTNGAPVLSGGPLVATTTAPVIGKSTDNTNFFDGFIDDVRVFDTALHPVQIKMLGGTHVPFEFASIQNAITAAVDGDQIVVGPGTRAENINFLGKSIRVVASKGPDQTTIDGSNVSPVVTFNSNEDAEAVIEGFTITNGDGDGAGIFIDGSSPTIKGNKIQFNNNFLGTQGGGIYVNNGAPLIKDNTIDGNQATMAGGNGGGIAVEGNSGGTVIDGNTIKNNVANSAGCGIHVNISGGPLKIINNTIANNEAGASTTPDGGGIAVIGGSVDILGNTILDNQATQGGGIYWNSAGNLLLNGNDIRDNDAVDGGGILVDGTVGATGTISNNLFTENKATNRGGGGLFVVSSTFDVVNNTIVKNISDFGNGAGIEIDNTDNATVNLGNNIIASNQRGAGIKKAGGAAVITIDSNNVFSNSGGNYVGLSDQTGSNGNISVDPNFRNIASYPPDLRLQSGSPSIDAGNNGFANTPSSDYDGVSRPAGPNVDQGAFEDLDTDSDGMSDGYELANGLDPNVNDAAGDPDGDGLSNINEHANGTDPQNPDTDFDGMNDNYEVTNNLNPTTKDGHEDPDGDRFPNLYEDINGTDPNNAASTPTPDYFVSNAGNDANDGSSPAPGDAFFTIQKALDTAAALDIIEVADGTFIAAGNTNLDFSPLAGEGILIMSENSAETTVIDCQSFASRRGMSFNDGETESTIVSGFSIINGVFNKGGAILFGNNTGSPVLRDMHLVNNLANGGGGFGGGAFFVETSVAPWLINCKIVDNQAIGSSGGAGFFSANSAARIRGCTISGNKATGGSGRGGGLYYQSEAGGVVRDSVISGNEAGEDGGGVYSFNADPDFINDFVVGNKSNGTMNGGGGFYILGEPSPEIINSTISKNVTMGMGGALLNDMASTELINTISWDNRPDEIKVVNNPPNPVVAFSDILGGFAGTGNIDKNPLFVKSDAIFGDAADSVIIDNGVALAAGDIGTPLRRVAFRDNAPINGVYEAEDDAWIDANDDNIFDAGETIIVNPGTLLIGAEPSSGEVFGVFFLDNDADNVFTTGDDAWRNGEVGAWTITAAYDPAKHTTTLTDSGASFIPNELVGAFINPELTQDLLFLIVSNTATTIEVCGDLQSIASGGSLYEIFDLQLRRASPAIDAALGDSAPALDILMQSRKDEPGTVNTGQGAPDFAEMGAVEFCPPNIEFNVASSNDAESNTSPTYIFKLSKIWHEATSVEHTTVNNTAIATDDFSATAGVTVNIPAFTISNNFNITVVDDLLVEVNENFDITLANPFNAVLGATTTHTYTINDDDNGPVLVNNTGDTVDEGSTGNDIDNTGLKFTDVEDGAANVIYTLDVAPANGQIKNNGVNVNQGNTVTQADIDAVLITYDHDGSETTSDTFQFTVTDSDTNTNPGAPTTFNITVTAVNDPPVITPAAPVVATEETPYVYVVTVTDPDDPNDGSGALTWTLTNAPAGMTVSTTGQIDWTPGEGVTTSGAVTVTVADGGEDAAAPDNEVFTVTVAAVNDDPTITEGPGPVVVNMDEDDNPIPFDLTLNATDIEGDTITWSISTPATKGTATATGTGASKAIGYTPNDDFNGADTFVVRIDDGNGGTATITVNINVNPINDPPVAVPDAFTVDEDTLLTADAAGGVLKNDTDPENDALTVTIVNGTTDGVLVMAGNGSFNYTPSEHFNGSDSFTYKVNDGTVDSNVVTVTIEVNSINDAPAPMDDEYPATEDVALMVTAPGVLTNDIDADDDSFTALLNTGPSKGVLVLSEDGSFTYTPNPNTNGPDSFTYRAFDGTAQSEPAMVNINVAPQNDPPVAFNDTMTTNEDTPVVITVITNDTDLEGNLTVADANVTITQQPANGSLVINNLTAAVTYTPNLDFNGTDTFKYTVDDDTPATSNAATVTVTVTPVNDPPVGNVDVYGVVKNTPLNVNVAQGLLDNDTDADDDDLTVALVIGVQNGTLALLASGSFTYTPDNNFFGTDTFTYMANDGTANSAVTNVSINVSDNDVPPVAIGDNYPVDEDTTLTVPDIGVLLNDMDGDGDTLFAVLTQAPTRGTLVLAPGGGFTYTPNANYNGMDAFDYHASDGALISADVTVTITVNPQNDAPVVNAGPTVAIAEGAIFQRLGSFADPDTADTWTGTVNYDDGTGDQVLPLDGMDFNLDHVFADNGDFTVVVTIEDNNLGVATDTFVVNVQNALPTVDAGDPLANAEGRTVELINCTFNDPGTRDTHTATIDWGDGSPAQPGTVTETPFGPPGNALGLDGTVAGSHVFADDGTFTVTVTVTDDDGASASDTTEVTITNAAPTINPGANQIIDEGDELFLDPATFNDPGTADTHTATIDWGDLSASGPGVVTETPTGPPGSLAGTDGTVAASHIFEDDGNYTVMVTVSDDNLGTITDTFTVRVDNVAPTAVGDTFAMPDSNPLTIPAPGVLANDFDASPNDSLMATLQMMPLTGDVVLNADGSFVYTPGPGFNGSDSFTYIAGDGTDVSQEVTVQLAVGLEPALMITDVAIDEGDDPDNPRDLIFFVTLFPASSEVVMVNAATTAGTALAVSDFDTFTQTLTFQPGIVMQEIHVAIVGDTLNENNETFTVQLTNPVNAGIDTATATGTITNDDAVPTVEFAVQANANSESASPVLLQVNLSAASGLDITVPFAQGPGATASSGVDFNLTAGDLTIPAGAAGAVISLVVINDPIEESDETVVIDLGAPTNATLGPIARHIHTINNDDDVLENIQTVFPVDGASDVRPDVILRLSMNSAPIAMRAISADAAPNFPDDFFIGEHLLTVKEFVDLMNELMAESDPDLVCDAQGNAFFRTETGLPLFLIAENNDVTEQISRGGNEVSLQLFDYDIKKNNGQYTYDTAFANHPIFGVTWFGACFIANRLSDKIGAPRAITEGNTDDDWHPAVMTMVEWTTAEMTLAHLNQLNTQFRSSVRLPFDHYSEGQSAGNEFFLAMAEGIPGGGTIFDAGNSTNIHPRSVFAHPPNAFGVRDPSGQAWEWQLNSRVGDSLSDRVLRGGSWFNDIDAAMANVRIAAPPRDGYADGGVRLMAPVAMEFQFELATDAAFTMGVQTSQWSGGHHWQPPLLSPTTEYFWRVRARHMALSVFPESPWFGPQGSPMAYASFTTSTQTEQMMSQSLGAGWHLLGTAIEIGNRVPFQELVASPQNCFGPDSFGWEWVAELQQYQKLETIKPFKGFWIYLPNPIVNMEVTGYNALTPLVNASTGWNILTPLLDETLLFPAPVIGEMYFYDHAGDTYRMTPFLKADLGVWVFLGSPTIIDMSVGGGNVQ